jgi:predicted nucleotidyltransferase
LSEPDRQPRRSHANRVESKQGVIDRLQEVRRQVTDLGVRRVALFGSFLRDHVSAESDVDLLVEFDPAMKTLDNFLDFCFLMDEILGRRVEVVTMEALSPYIGPHILREAEDVLRAA